MIQNRDQDRDDHTPDSRPAVSAQAADVFARPDVFAKPQVPVLETARDSLSGSAGELAFDPAAIMASIGETPYEWSIDSDVRAWGANAMRMRSAVLPRSRAGAITPSCWRPTHQRRFDAVISARDEGTGVPYQVQYALHPAGAEKAL